MDRLAVTTRHIFPHCPSGGIECVPCDASSRVGFDALQQSLDGHNLGIRDEIKRLLTSDPVFQFDHYDLPKHEIRSLSLLQFRHVIASLRHSGLKLEMLATDPDQFLAILETISLHPNYGIAGKFAIHWGLFGATILFLGNKTHHDTYLADISSGELLGSFAMTELRGGSNVRALATTATYDVRSEEFVIDTPNTGAQKYWIGGAAEHSHMAVVFAQLITGGKQCGIHVFIVPLRDRATHAVVPGVRIVDCGHKKGVNCLDNGRIWFDHVRVPRANLLDKLGSVAADGTYTSAIASDGVRFAAHLSELVFNRAGMASTAVNLSKIGLATAIRYGAQRRQFGGSPNEPETPILDYITHQRRLLPHLATILGLNFATNELKEMLFPEMRAHVRDAKPYSKELHIRASGLKIVATWEAVETLQQCRECCGGQGYASVNRIGSLFNDVEHLLTVEGDNTVLSQQLSKHLLDALQKGAAPEFKLPKNVPPDTADFAYLRSHELLSSALAYHERALLNKFAAQLQSSIAGGMSPSAAWTAHLDTGLELSLAHIHSITFASFARAVTASTGHTHHQHALHIACSLYGIWQLHRNMGFFLSQKQPQVISTATQGRAVASLVNVLCAELRPYAVQLVDAFGIPCELMGPIARDDYETQFK